MLANSPKLGDTIPCHLTIPGSGRKLPFSPIGSIDCLAQVVRVDEMEVDQRFGVAFKIVEFEFNRNTKAANGGPYSQ